LNNILSIKLSSVYLLSLLALLALAAVLYVYAFINLLEIGETVGHGFQAIVQSDTILFRDIYQNFNIGAYLDANVKNTVFPAVIWSAIDGNWYISIIVNIAFLFGAAIYLRRIAEQLEINVNYKIMLFLVFLPETFIYLIGILKEIPTLLFFSATTFYFLKKQWYKFLLCLLFLTLFRYQFIFSLALFVFGYKIFGRNNIRFLFVVFAVLSASYPLLVNTVQGLGLEDARLYREIGAGLGIGAWVESIQLNVYGISFFATIVKFFQMMVEPWPALNLYDESGVNIIAILYAISAVIWLPIWFKYFRHVFYAIRKPGSLTRDQNVILCISFSFLIMVALNSFVHHRYLYPGMGLILLIAFVPMVSRKNSN